MQRISLILFPLILIAYSAVLNRQRGANPNFRATSIYHVNIFTMQNQPPTYIKGTFNIKLCCLNLSIILIVQNK